MRAKRRSTTPHARTRCRGCWAGSTATCRERRRRCWCAVAVPEDWARQDDRWRSLDELIARYESEFAGRLLIGRDDVERWRAEPSDGLCWGMLGVAGFDSLIREPADLDRLPGLFERGVRVFQPVESGTSLLAGSADPGDDRGLTELGRSFLARLAELAGGGEPRPRPIVDLAHLNARSMAEVIKLATEGALAGRLLLMYSHGALVHEGFATPRALDHDNLVALRAGGGVIGLTPGRPYHRTPVELRAGIEAAASVPFEGRQGYEGIAIGSDFLGIEQTLPASGQRVSGQEMDHPRFDRETAVMLIAGQRPAAPGPRGRRRPRAGRHGPLTTPGSRAALPRPERHRSWSARAGWHEPAMPFNCRNGRQAIRSRRNRQRRRRRSRDRSIDVRYSLQCELRFAIRKARALHKSASIHCVFRSARCRVVLHEGAGAAANWGRARSRRPGR